MNWKQTFFKPKWQSNDVEIRLNAVTTEQQPELISSLVEIARSDPDKRVRSAAIKRLHQLENILNLHGSEADPEVKKLLEDRIRQLASASNESRPALELRMQVVEITSDRDLIEHLAGHAPEAGLRRAALVKVERQGVLGDCCISDSDAGNRNFAASRITQHTTLKRVIDALRKSDKSLYAKLQERLHKQLLESGDPGAVKIEALRICTELEKRLLDIEARNSAETEALHSSWQRIATHASVDLVERYQRVCDRLTAPPPVKPEPVVVTPDSPAQAAVAAIAESEVELPAAETLAPQANVSLSRLAAAIELYAAENAENPAASSINKMRQQLEKTWKHCNPPLPEDLACFNAASAGLAKLEASLERQRQQLATELGQAQELLIQLQAELEQGELHKALETRAKLQQAAKGHGKNKEWQNLNDKMTATQARLRELRDWQHWSNDKIRKRLIDEMEALPAADLHPDALLDRIKSLQLEWKELEQSEQIPGDKKFSSAPWMWRKFSAAGHAAFEPAKPFLDKRSEIQSRHAEILTDFCAELVQLTQTEPVDWLALGKGITTGRKKLADLNEVPARQRQKLARKLKTALDKANAVVQARNQVIEGEKMKLIRAASQLTHLPERSEAITQAKTLQTSWKAAGSLWRAKEQELWDQFRAHIDPLFAELKNQQDSIRAADNDRLAAQKTLCNELRDILKSKDDLSSLHGKVQGLQDSWKDIEHADPKLQGVFQGLFADYQARLKKTELQQVQTDRERWWLKSALLHELTVSGRTAKGALSKKTETRVASAWPANSSGDALESRMDEIYKEILAGSATEPTAEEIESKRIQARDLCIALEFLAGLPSPDEERAQRMKYQVDRLAQSMSGTSTRQPASEEALAAEKIWLGLYALPEADFGFYGKRFKRALSTVLETV